MKLDIWAKKWGIQESALKELEDLFMYVPERKNINCYISSEKDVQNLVQMEAAIKGCVLWRNNVGALENKKGKIVRYGLANTSKTMNDGIKSSDLIGIRKVKITENMVGTTIGQFLSREIKRSDWKFKGTPHELAQKRFIQWVLSMGGDAGFANGQGTI